MSRLDYCEEGPHPFIRYAFNAWLLNELAKATFSGLIQAVIQVS